jgi:hypothetical protein
VKENPSYDLLAAYAKSSPGAVEIMNLLESQHDTNALKKKKPKAVVDTVLLSFVLNSYSTIFCRWC